MGVHCAAFPAYNAVSALHSYVLKGHQLRIAFPPQVGKAHVLGRKGITHWEHPVPLRNGNFPDVAMLP